MNVFAEHPEKRFLDAWRSKKDQIKNHLGDVVAYKDAHCPVLLNGEPHPSTVWKTKCELLTSNVKCEVCKLYMSVLRSMHNCLLKLNSDMKEVMEESSNKVYESHPPCRIISSFVLGPTTWGNQN